MKLWHGVMFAVTAELQKEKRKLESKGNLKEVAAVCNKIGELLSRLGMYTDHRFLSSDSYAKCRQLTLRYTNLLLFTKLSGLFVFLSCLIFVLCLMFVSFLLCGGHEAV